MVSAIWSRLLVELGAKEVDPLKSEHAEHFEDGVYPRSAYTPDSRRVEW